MTDIQKVMTGLQCLITDKIPCGTCQYNKLGNCVKLIARDAKKLIKDQQKLIKSKEQEAVKPQIDAFGHSCCPECKMLVYETWEFCPHCGQAVKWE